ncbi:hypothetical protein PROFUN_06849 [Planoprotostelium fungivorum]|uniref:Uncharacterized protein n=1 Tax=Planoprotostelium fungivorum TaxID=1890364 RepID=A0A2P6NNE4_9EUKA|nr:hypothetical protein PROFUN_06849 [Planoprotostelium fungivorum]
MFFNAFLSSVSLATVKKRGLIFGHPVGTPFNALYYGIRVVSVVLASLESPCGTLILYSIVVSTSLSCTQIAWDPGSIPGRGAFAPLRGRTFYNEPSNSHQVQPSNVALRYQDKFWAFG